MPTLDSDRLFLNKWEMHQALAAARIGPCRLPDTEFATEAAIIRFLQQYPAIYLKPIGGWGGHSIIRVEARNGRFAWQEQGFQPMTLQTDQDVSQRFLDVYSGQRHPAAAATDAPNEGPQAAIVDPGRTAPPNATPQAAGAPQLATEPAQPALSAAIVQQAAPLRTVDNCPFDLRILLQRDVTDAWVVAGSVARIGGQGAIVSNVGISGGSVLSQTHLFDKLQLRPKMRRAIATNIRAVALNVANAINPYRDFEEIGIDVGLDSQHQLWLIEVNTNDNMGGPSHDLFAQLPDKRLYRAIRARAEARQLALLNEIWSKLNH